MAEERRDEGRSLDQPVSDRVEDSADAGYIIVGNSMETTSIFPPVHSGQGGGSGSQKSGGVESPEQPLVEHEYHSVKNSEKSQKELAADRRLKALPLRLQDFMFLCALCVTYIVLTLRHEDDVLTSLPPMRCEFCVDYKPYKAIVQPTNITKEKLDFVYVILTQHSADAFARRQFIRRTWASEKYISPLKGHHFFSVGFAGQCQTCNMAALIEENKIYNDLVIFDFMENYRGNMTLKFMVTLNYAYQTYNTDTFIKIDDDTILRLHQIVWRMNNRWNQRPKENFAFIMGKCEPHNKAYRDPRSKFYVPERMFRDRIYPLYPFGPCFAINRLGAAAILEQARTVPVTWGDDVSIGILARSLAENFTFICHGDWLVTIRWGTAPLWKFKRYMSVHASQMPVDLLEHKIWPQFG